jgi:lipoprotein-anchoring transpeptidase ErfK/SrfK
MNRMLTATTDRIAATPTRRMVLIAAMPAILGACTQTIPRGAGPVRPLPVKRVADPYYAQMYAELQDNGFTIPAIDTTTIDQRYLRQIVDFPTPYIIGTIVVDPGAKFLYLIQEHGRALRYGIGVGREGFGWSGVATIRRKAIWPTWTPPAEMIARDPLVAQHAGGMPGGLDNPLGARALYLYQGNRDTLYRLHGTSDPRSIGRAVSSGCVRLLNHDIIDLHRRTPIGTNVQVLGTGSTALGA